LPHDSAVEGRKFRRNWMRRYYSAAVWLSLALPIVAFPAVSQAQVICTSNNVPPPELPVYDQPPIPAPGYIWTPGYWAGGPSGYFWVPGTWVEPPSPGLLWTPGYWAWRDGIYTWSAGYWGTHVGFYGGVDYGFGYTGSGYEGGRWDNGVFAYNRTVNNLGGVSITNVYEKTVVVDVNTPRVSYNGGSGGITARPTPEQEAAAHEQHIAAVPAQMQHERTASTDRSLLASENHGRPAIAATSKPGEFSGKGVIAAREAEPRGATIPTKPGGAALTSAPGETRAVGGQERPGEARPNPERPSQERTGQERTGQERTEQERPGQERMGQKPLNAETKPLGLEQKPANAAGKPPLGNEAKLPNDAKPPISAARPLNGEMKPSPGAPKPPGAEVKLPGPKPEAAKPQAAKPQAMAPQGAVPQVAKPQVAMPPKGPNPPPPHLATAPGPAAHPAPAGAPHPKPGPNDKKPPG
jgi:hypothetical protein